MRSVVEMLLRLGFPCYSVSPCRDSEGNFSDLSARKGWAIPNSQQEQAFTAPFTIRKFRPSGPVFEGDLFLVLFGTRFMVR